MPTERLDRIVRLAGEAVAARLRVELGIGSALVTDPGLETALADLTRTLATLQRETLATRMVTFATIAEPLRRAARDAARRTGKEVSFVIEGERAELDRAVLDELRDPLLHLVRNAVDHGLEKPDWRSALGKPRVGTVTVSATRRGGEFMVSVADDGRGLDLDALRAAAGVGPELDDDAAAELIFSPGLSTAAAVTDLSGRGVGLDVVRAALERVRGRIMVASDPGQGCGFTISMPMTLAVMQCLLVKAGGESYALPVHAATTIVESPDGSAIPMEGGYGLRVGDDMVAMSPLATAVGAPPPDGPAPAAVVLRNGAGRRHAFSVDGLLGQREVTVQELGDIVPRLELVSGASVEADGSVLLVLDPSALVDSARNGHPHAAPSHSPAASRAAPRAPAEPLRILVVDDAMTVRELQRSILERAGYEVSTASDGDEALARLGEARPDLVLTDIEMPRCDGFALTEAIRAHPRLASLPVIIVSSRSSEEDRRRGLDVGADAYVVKQDFDEASLLAAVADVLGRTPR